MHIILAFKMAVRGLSRSFTAGVSRCFDPGGGSPPRLPDLLSNSHSGDSARAIPSRARGSAGWVGRAILFVLCLADGDASAVRGPRASAMRPRRKTIGRDANRTSNEHGAATVVMAAQHQCHRVMFKAG